MARWIAGERTVRYLLDQGRLEAIDASALGPLATALVDRATRRAATAGKALELGDIEGAYAAAYDSYRIAAEALLARQGLRASGREGSHMTVEDAVSAQFTKTIAGFAKPTFEQIRRTRHTAQYFDPSAPSITSADAEWAIAKATAVVADVTRLLSEAPPDLFD